MRWGEDEVSSGGGGDVFHYKQGAESEQEIGQGYKLPKPAPK